MTVTFDDQVERFADLYSSSCYNLLHYPQFYFFRAPMTLMPHEINIDRSLHDKVSNQQPSNGISVVRSAIFLCPI
ncbi:unnamed protein product [Gongylonema pulchrum]|uniref:Uncharacterized protein n=1 Tax=Gongylonema pulchrum TaxID=637853 RepID=A0A183D902_9BILA|nr:unnamed protein product [Gongylonema pulchrum]